jgi:hypothetical protein
MSERLNNLVLPADPASLDTVKMYDRIPGTFAGHFAGFRSTLPDIQRAHDLAGVPVGESQVVEIGCGDGRDAENYFVPNAGTYVGYDPSEGLLDIARNRFPDAPKDMFRVGYAQTTDYPEGTDIMMSVNSVLHVPRHDLPEMFERVAVGLREDGVFYGITKAEEDGAVEVYHDDFDGVTGERTFYHHTPDALTEYAGKAGLGLVFAEITPVPTKTWDWYSFAVAKNA